MLAREVGCEDLILFIRDPESSAFLPAHGFPQTMPKGRWWRALLDEAAKTGRASGELEDTKGTRRQVEALSISDDSMVALLGGELHPDAVEDLLRALPVLAALLRGESEVQIATAQSAMARRSASEANALARQLDNTRAELRRALIVAEAAARTRDEFLATVSHELRTPLTGILGWAQILRADGLVHEEGTQALETIERNARALTLLIEDILDFSRINAGKLRIDVKPTDLVDVIRNSVEVVRPAANAKEVKIQVTLATSAAAVSGDPDRLQQVVWNLMSNALKFTPKGGRIQVILERINSHMEISVIDTGEGIDPEFLPFVFDRFSQADTSSSRSYAGLGLGLGIVKNLVELHGGSVRAYSEGLGKGAMFVVRIPILALRSEDQQDRPMLSSPDDPALALADMSDSRFPDLHEVSILVVDDNEDVREILSKLFSRCSARVILAASAEEGFNSLRLNPPDIVVSDIEMPGGDGYSLIRKIRSLSPPDSLVPAVALTAHTRTVDRVRALSAGFQAHVVKPVDPIELASVVRSLLNMRTVR